MSEGAVTLEQEMITELKHWKRSTRAYGFTYYALRIVLILASTVVAAKENLDSSTADALVRWVPVLSLIVAILTTLDTWLKPAQRWIGFMESRDRLSDLIFTSSEGKAVAQLRGEFLDVRKDHRQRNIF